MTDDDRDSLAIFVASIRLQPEDWDNCDGDDLAQAVQNAVGRTGAAVIDATYVERATR